MHHFGHCSRISSLDRCASGADRDRKNRAGHGISRHASLLLPNVGLVKL
jgi:hypothetical protein